ncbi:MAG: NAD(P)H-dependent oxidoreductase [Acidobacteriota bacterium]
MHVLIVLAHPGGDSFNGAVCRALIQGLAEAGHTWDLADLHAERFRPVLEAEELRTLGSSAPAADVAGYQRRILDAQALAFVFPIWWFGMPAILKGFIDRVFQENFAFRFTPAGTVEGLLPHEKALVINTAGGGANLYRLFGFGKPLEKVFDRWTLRMCGIRKVRHVVFHDVVNTDDAARRRYLEETSRLGRHYFSQ